MQVLLCCLALLAGARQVAAQTANYIGVVNPVGSGFDTPYGVAVDANGNVFVADMNNNAVKEIVAGTNGAAAGTVNANSKVISVGSGFYWPQGVAVDAKGNVFVGDTYNNAVKEIVAGTNGAAAGTVNANSKVVTVGSGFGRPQGVAVDANGNVFVADIANSLVKEIVAGTNGAAAGTVNDTSQVIYLKYINSPAGVAVDANGNVFVGDINSYVYEIVAGTNGAAAGTVNNSSTMIQVGSGFSHPAGVAVDANGNVFVADVNNNAVKEIVAGTGGAASGTVNSNSTVKSFGDGYYQPNRIAVAANGTIFVSLHTNGADAVTEIQPGTANFGSVASGLTTPPTQTLTFTFTGAGAIGGVSVQSPGGMYGGQDFSDTKTGTCASTTYNIGDTCTVVVSFSPLAPGVRVGAVQLNGTGGSTIATARVAGTGLVPVLAYPNPFTDEVGGMGSINRSAYAINTSSWVYIPQGLDARGVALDPSGNLYVSETSNGTVVEFVAGTGDVAIGPLNAESAQLTIPSSGGFTFKSPEGLAIDFFGNVFVADPGRAEKVLKVVGNTVTQVGSGFGNVHHIAVDTSGNLWVADTDHNAVKEVLAGPDGTVNASSTVNTVGTGFTSPYGIAVDVNGNVFVSDAAGVKEIVAGTGGATVKLIKTVFGSHSGGLSLDAFGNLFVGNTGSGTIAAKIVAGSSGTVSEDSDVSTIAINGYGSNSWDVAVNPNGYLFILDQPVCSSLSCSGGNINAAIYVLSYETAPTLIFDKTTDGLTSQAQSLRDSVGNIRSVQSVTVVNTGNAPLVFSAPSVVSYGYSDGFAIDTSSATTCPLTSGTLAVGATCKYSAIFTPKYPMDGTITGAFTINDNAGPGHQSFNLSGTAAVPVAAALKFTTPPPAYQAVGGNAAKVVVSVTDGGVNIIPTASGAITLRLMGPAGQTAYTQYPSAGQATFDLSSVPLNTAYNYEYYAEAAASVNGACTIFYAQTSYCVGATTAYENVVGDTSTAPSEKTGTTSNVVSVIALFDSATTLNSDPAKAIQVLTMGATNGDFAYATGGTCAAGSTYSAGQACTVNYTFMPKYPGLRMGAIVLYDSTGAPVKTIYLSGAGTGPMVTYPSNTTANAMGSGLSEALGSAAVDGSGNVFVANFGNRTVSEFVAGTNGAAPGTVDANSTVLTFSSGIAGPTGVAIDGAGNLFVADYNGNAVVEILAGTGGAAPGTVNANSTVIPVGHGFLLPFGIAVDANGNVFVTDSVSGSDTPVGEVKEIVAGGDGALSTSSTVKVVGSGFNIPYGVTVDASGNVFVADYLGDAVKEIVAGTGGATNGTVNSGSNVIAIGSGFSRPISVAVDVNGNVFVADSGNKAVKEIVNSTGVLNAHSTVNTIVSGPTASGISLDATGNLFVVDMSVDSASELPFATAPSLSFPGTLNGATSAAQTVTVANSGNAPLTFPIPTTGNNPSIANYFTLESTGATACTLLTSSSTTAATLAAGATCTLPISFSPTAPASGTVSGSLILTDNSLNVTGTMQTITLSGAVTSPAPTATVAVASTNVSLNQPTSFTPITATGGNAPLVYSVSPSLPAGLSINSATGAITGTPTVASATTTYTVTVTDANKATSTANFSLTIAALTPTLSLTPSPASPSAVNTSVTFTAQLTGVTLTPATPAGTVTFLVNGSSSPDCPSVVVSAAGKATCTTAKLAAGTNQTVTATYSGDSNYVVAAAGSASYTVTAATSTLGLTASPSSSTMVGDTVTFTAQLAGVALTPVLPSGKVNFTANGSTLASCGAVTVNALGQATCTTTSLVAGSDPVTAVYSGDSNFTVAAPGTMTQTVTATTSTTVAPASLNYSPNSQTVSLTAAVSSSSGTVNVGTVTFSVFNGATQVGASVTSGTVTSGAASATFTLPAATTASGYSIHAVYNATAPYAASSDNSKSLTVTKATTGVSVTLGSLSQTYTGSPLSATATTTPSGLAVTFTYNGSATPPTAAGSYTVVATINDPNYQGSATGTLVIAKATTGVSVTLGNLSQTYTGSPLSATATTTPSGLAVTYIYNGSATPPTAAGSYTVVATINDPNYQGSTTGTMVIGKATATAITLGSLSQTYTGSPLSATATTTPSGLAVTFTYNGSATPPTAVGSYTVVATISDNNYQGTATGTLVIGKATAAAITLGSLSRTYTGSPLAVTATTTPSGLAVTYTYNGSATPPTAVGSYTVVGTINDPDYQGTATGTLVINKATPGVVLTSNSNPVLVQNSITLTATVSSTASTPTGAVTFLDGTTPLGTGAVNASGIATLPISTLAVGSHSITAVYSGDSNFIAATSSALPQIVQDFNLTISIASSGGTTGVTSVTALPGGTAVYTFTLSPVGSTTFPAVVTLSASGLPTGATYTFSPATLAAGSGSTQVTLTVNLPQLSAMNLPHTVQHTATPAEVAQNKPSSKLPFLALALLLLPFTRRMRRASRKLGRLLPLLLLLIGGLAAISGLSGCGSSSGYFGQAPATYTISVTGTSGVLTHSTSVTLTVQ